MFWVCMQLELAIVTDETFKNRNCNFAIATDWKGKLQFSLQGHKVPNAMQVIISAPKNWRTKHERNVFHCYFFLFSSSISKWKCSFFLSTRCIAKINTCNFSFAVLWLELLPSKKYWLMKLNWLHSLRTLRVVSPIQGLTSRKLIVDNWWAVNWSLDLVL